VVQVAQNKLPLSRREPDEQGRVRVLAIGVPLYGYANAYSYRRFRSFLLIHIMEFRGILGRDRSRSFQPVRPSSALPPTASQAFKTQMKVNSF
jgi:hypothetical protein